jgi:hypothetical protein
MKGAFGTLSVPKAPFEAPAMSQTRLSGRQPANAGDATRRDHRRIQVERLEGALQGIANRAQSVNRKKPGIGGVIRQVIELWILVTECAYDVTRKGDDLGGQGSGA